MSDDQDSQQWSESQEPEFDEFYLNYEDLIDDPEDDDDEDDEEDDYDDDDEDEFDDLDRRERIIAQLEMFMQGEAPMRMRIERSRRRAEEEALLAARRKLMEASEQCYDDIKPSSVGRELMKSGDFGSDESQDEPFPRYRDGVRQKPRLSSLLLARELGAFTGPQARRGKELMAQCLIPSSKADFIIHYDARAYSGQFSEDGNFFYTCSQDFRVRMYDTSDPYDWKYYKVVDYPNGNWTITDSTLSPDNRFLAYSSITTTVYMAGTGPEISDRHALPFAVGRQNRSSMRPHAGIWSLRFSGDGREILAGANDCCLYVYDIETRTPVLKLEGHTEDVNAVCYADKSSPHILYSGSDDTTIKVWDRRSMANGREVGLFVGHMEGITYIDSKGDGTYLLSNSKDQTMKLWDIRRMMEPGSSNGIRNLSSGYDYRTDEYENFFATHPNDKSLVTYTSHSIYKTLIRCHFSPPNSSGSRYVYTGSSNGSAYIYNIDSTVEGVINVQQQTMGTNPSINNRSFRGWGWGSSDEEMRACIRDVSWHPNAPVLAATAWGGYCHGMGTVSVHSWNGVGGGKIRMSKPVVNGEVVRRFGAGMEEL